MGKKREYNPSDKARKIVEKIKEMTAVASVSVTRKEGGAIPALTDSKFGGVPYWDMEKEYPTDQNGRKMILLAQIHFPDLREAGLDLQEFGPLLPAEGMLQFFITPEDDCFGMDFEEPASQKDFRVVYHGTVRGDVTREQVLGLGIVTAGECEEYTPVLREAALSFGVETTYMNPNVAGFSAVFVQAVKAVTGEEITEETWYGYFGEEDESYLYDELPAFGHRMFGYPSFTQTDPRENMAEEEAVYYDTLLLQIDSDMGEDGDDYVLWGDCGVANLLMNGEALRKKDFGRVLYNWDCC